MTFTLFDFISKMLYNLDILTTSQGRRHETSYFVPSFRVMSFPEYGMLSFE